MVGKRRLRTEIPLPSLTPAGPGACPLCGRPLIQGASVDEHHLVPRSQGGREASLIHRICHRKIHATFTEKELARHYHSWPALKAHPAIADFIHWVADKPPEFYRRNASSHRKRSSKE